MEELLRRIAALPPIISGQDDVRPPNSPIRLHSGVFLIRQGGRKVRLNGTISFHWLPTPEVRFEGRSSGNARLELEAGTLTSGRGGLRGEVLILSEKHSTSSTVEYGGIFNARAVMGERRKVRRVDFELVNFAHYNGAPVRMSERGIARARLTGLSQECCLYLDQLPEYDELRRAVRTHGGYAVTHRGRIQRRDAGLLDYAEATELLAAAHFFLAFLAGQWVGPVRPIGVGRKTTPLWREYSSWKATSRVTRTWLPSTSPVDVSEIYGSFSLLWESEVWRRSLKALIYWYVQANAESGSSEAAAVAAFIPLEMLAWLILVEDGNRMSRRRFESLATAARLEQLLVTCGIPVEVPRTYERLRHTTLYRKYGNGPSILTAYRNSLVHPTKKSRNFTFQIDSGVKYELRELALTYVELAVLAKLGYSGRYSRRVFSGWRGQEEEVVPWSEVPAERGT